MVQWLRIGLLMQGTRVQSLVRKLRSHVHCCVSQKNKKCSGEPRRIIAACANRGQIDDLPREATVETWAMASRCGIHPVASGKLPPSVKGLMEQVVCEEELAVEAALTGNFDTLVESLVASPMVTDKRVAPQLAKELIEGNRQYLPQFKDI